MKKKKETPFPRVEKGKDHLERQVWYSGCLSEHKRGANYGLLIVDVALAIVLCDIFFLLYYCGCGS